MTDERPASFADRLRKAAAEAVTKALQGVDRLIGSAAPAPVLVPIRVRARDRR